MIAREQIRDVTPRRLRWLIDRLRDEFQQVRDGMVTVTVVATAAELPANAPAAAVFRVVAEPTAIYYGSGPSRPLLKVTGTAA